MHIFLDMYRNRSFLGTDQAYNYGELAGEDWAALSGRPRQANAGQYAGLQS